jgi:hypothetical protein
MEEDILRECPWGALLIVRLHQAGNLPRLTKSKYAPLRALLASLPKRQETWNDGQQAVMCALAGELYGLGKDLLDDVNAALRRQGQTLWVVYHGLETIFAADPARRREVVTGLFEMVQALDARHIEAIRPLIFIQETLWTPLNFENKSHFTGRDLCL